MIKVQLTLDQAEGLQKFVTQHIEHCIETLGNEESCYVTPKGELFKSYAYYCGCPTCDTREQLMATFDYLRKLGVVNIFVSDEK
jgi:hypothetical protein